MIGKTEKERIEWLKANLRPVEVVDRAKLAEWNRRISDPIRRQRAIDSVWQATRGKSSYDRRH